MINYRKYDVIILGGGTSGCACAYTCAKNNLKTLLVEKNNFLGGLMTGGLVIPVMKSSVSNLNCNFYKKLVKEAKKIQGQITYKDNNDGWFNPQLLKIALDSLLTKKDVSKNLDILFETTLSNVNKKNDAIQNVILNSDFLSIPVEAKYYIDATGSGQLSTLAKCKFLDDDNLKQQNSLRFILGNINIEKFCKFIKKIDKNEDITNTYQDDRNTNNELHFTTASTWDTNTFWAMDEILKKGVKDKILKETDRSYFQVFSVAGSTNQVAFNCPRINNYNDDAFLSSNELIEARKAIYRLWMFAKKYFPGFENSEIINIATQTGIRESKRVKTKYIFKKDDLISGKKFKNAILKANYSIDVHSKEKNKSILNKIGSYEFPLESLMSADVENLYVLGKIIGADFYAHSALRVQKSCMSMGEGLGNYLSKK